MASHPRSNPVQPAQQPHGAPYCNDPLCEHCKQLRDMQELIRLHEPPANLSYENEVDEEQSDENDR